MTTSTEKTIASNKQGTGSLVWRWLGRLFRFCLALIVIAASGGIAYYWVSNPPTTERRPRGPEAILVETTPVEIDRHQVIIHAMGTVKPAREMQLASRVSGQIVEVSPNFVPGGRYEAGSQLLKIDPKDYEIAVRQQEGNLTRMESDVRIEMGQQQVARREYELLGDEIGGGDEALLLRVPQLAAKKAAVDVAEATLEKARLDLERTAINAPFNAIIHSRNVELGAYVSPGSSLAAMIGTDVFWVETSVPVDELRHITLPDDHDEAGSEARVYHPAAWGPDTYRTGSVVKLLPDLEPRGRMGRVLIAVENPLGASDPDKPPLLLDSFVRVRILGSDMEGVAEIPRTALRGGDYVWIMCEENTLDIREVEIVWSARDVVYVASGVEAGEAMIISGVGTPVPGMPLRTEDMPVEVEGPGNGRGQGQGHGKGGGR